MDLPSSSDLFRLSVEEFDTTTHLAHAAQQRDKYNLDDVLIIDVDAHHYETEYMGAILARLGDPVLQHLAVSSAGKGGGRTGFMNQQPGYQDMGNRVTRNALRRLETTPKDGRHRDVHMSLKWMDAMGVDYACIFPTPMLGLSNHPQPEMQINFARAYNEWLVEDVLSQESRLKSMLFLPFVDHKATYEMVRDLGDKKGVIGFMVTAVHQKPVYHNDYMKTYALLEEMGLPLAFHSAYNWNMPLDRTANRFITVHTMGFPMHAAFHLTNWIVNGLPVRFPKLKVVWIEGGVAWVPWLMLRLDNEYKMRSSEAPALKKLPSEYMKDMFFATQPMERPTDTALLEAMFDAMDAKNTLVYSSDYPHWDMDLPSVIWELPFLDEQAKRNILGENARRLYGFDVSERYPSLSPAR